jgi:dethiobiotin synthetase
MVIKAGNDLIHAVINKAFNVIVQIGYRNGCENHAILKILEIDRQLIQILNGMSAP